VFKYSLIAVALGMFLAFFGLFSLVKGFGVTLSLVGCLVAYYTLPARKRGS